MKVRCQAWKECRNERCPHRKVHIHNIHLTRCNTSCNKGADLLGLSTVSCEELIIKHNRNGANS